MLCHPLAARFLVIAAPPVIAPCVDVVDSGRQMESQRTLIAVGDATNKYYLYIIIYTNKYNIFIFTGNRKIAPLTNAKVPLTSLFILNAFGSFTYSNLHISYLGIQQRTVTSHEI